MNTSLNEIFKSKQNSAAPRSRIYIIAEIGVNHNGSLATAKKLMRASARIGVDAVKFQKRSLKDIYVKSLLKDSNTAEWSFQYLLPQLKKLELSKSDYRKLNAYAKNLKLDLIVSPFDPISAEFIKCLDLSAVKIPSADLTNWPLLKKVAGFKLPLIVSTGMWGEKEISKTSQYLKQLGAEFAFLHCQSTYPAPLESLNLNFIPVLKKYAPVIGYSGHERGIYASLAAVALGATIIEKHITLDKTQAGPDHKASLEPGEFAALVKGIREVEKALGGNKKIFTQAELLNQEVFAKSLTAASNLPAGHRLQKKDLHFKSPGKGIPPSNLDQWLNKKLTRDKKTDEYLTPEDFAVTASKLQKPKTFDFKKPWGVKCRFHDFKEYNQLKTPVVEFHCSDKDVTAPPQFTKKYTSQLILHAPEIIGKELVNLCSHNKGLLNRSTKIFQSTVETALALNPYFSSRKPKIVIHVGGMDLRDYPADTKQMMRQAAKYLKTIANDQVELLPENLPPRPWYLGGQWYQYAFMRPEEMAEFCKMTGLGMTFDICHAALYCSYANRNILEYIKIVKPYIRHVHISDASGHDGEGIQIGQGELNFKSIFQALADVSFSWVPEIWRGHSNKSAGLYQALRKLSEYKDLI